MPTIRLSLLVACQLASCATAWLVQPSAPSAVVVARAPISSIAMLAKKQKPKKRVKKTAAPARPTPTGPLTSSSTAPPPTTAATPPMPSASTFSASPTGAPLDDRLDSVLKRSGITQDSKDWAPKRSPDKLGAFGSGQEFDPNDPLARIPKAGQEVLEKFFAGGALVFGSAFILSGLAVALEAIAKVLGSPLPTPIDEALVQYVEPALTPSILILFAFSISLGRMRSPEFIFYRRVGGSSHCHHPKPLISSCCRLCAVLKQLQLGSESTGVLYVEKDDDSDKRPPSMGRL